MKHNDVPSLRTFLASKEIDVAGMHTHAHENGAFPIVPYVHHHQAERKAPMDEHILTRHLDIPAIDTLEVYRQHSGYEALTRVLRELSPQEVIETVKQAGLGGRGGAGFPTG